MTMQDGTAVRRELSGSSPRTDGSPEAESVPGLDGEDGRDNRRRHDASAPVGPLIAVLRRPLLTFLPILLVLLPALVFVFSRPPVYTASAQVLVGRIDVESSAVPGFVEANQQLAATYARLVSTTVIAERVAAAVDAPVGELRGNLEGSPIPESSIIQVETTAATAERARGLARATADALIAYVLESNENPERQQQLLDAYGAAAAELRAAESARNAVQGRLAQAEANDAPAAQLTDLRNARDVAQAALDEATLRATAAESAYRDSQRGAVDRGALQLITEAEVTGNDRSSRLQLAVVASVLVGGLIGVALALARENRDLYQGRRVSLAERRRAR